MAQREHLPTHLEVCGPVVCESRPFPDWKLPTKKFNVSLPDVPCGRSVVWWTIGQMSFRDVPESWLKENLSEMITKMSAAYEEGQEDQFQEKLRQVHGGQSVPAFSRAWNLNLAYTTTPVIPEAEDSVHSGDSFLEALQEVTFRHFYVTIFRHSLKLTLQSWARRDEQFQSGRRRTTLDVLERDAGDQIRRQRGEKAVLDIFKNVLNHEDLPFHLDDAIKGDEAASMARCMLTLGHFYSDDRPELRVERAKMIWGVAASMVWKWKIFTDSKRPTVELLVDLYCRKLLEAKKRQLGDGKCNLSRAREVEKDESDWDTYPVLDFKSILDSSGR
ncbi:Fc.00g097560.m01.CDS01 [Cosmosporella sp. VM-42]